MPTLYLRDVPEQIVVELRRRADLSRRSLNAEAIVCLEQALATDERRSRAKDALRQLAELRAAHPCVPGEPTGVDLIREGREER
jgi:plasmid stability protein